jgi:hypothetical protein
LLDKAETFLADPERADEQCAVRSKDEPRAARQHPPPLSGDPKNPAVTPSAIKMLLPEPSGLEGGSREWFAAQLTVIRMRPLGLQPRARARSRRRALAAETAVDAGDLTIPSAFWGVTSNLALVRA